MKGPQAICSLNVPSASRPASSWRRCGSCWSVRRLLAEGRDGRQVSLDQDELGVYPIEQRQLFLDLLCFLLELHSAFLELLDFALELLRSLLRELDLHLGAG